VGAAVLGVAGLAADGWVRQQGPSGFTLPAAAVQVSGTAVGRPPPAPSGPPGRVWGEDVTVRTVFQQPIDRLPEASPYVFRVTELEMEPGTRIYEHRQLGTGAHVVMRGQMRIEDLDAGAVSVYSSGQAYFEGLGPLHRASNPGSETNRVLMFDLLPASRGFDGTQQFTARGRHNEGELRSGPYVQIPLDELPSAALMFRVSELRFGPKAKTEEHVRVGPGLYFVTEGTATVRKDWANSSMTYGTNGYFFEGGREAMVLENKPASPARFLAVEVLPARLGDAPSSVPTR
jgi:quercetin dioxygenase-like cupin family protein